MFLQYEFDKQWKQLKKYANDKGVQIIGDIPIYVALDSADTWAHPELFQFTEDFEPIAVAGCPPDAFSETASFGEIRYTAGNTMNRRSFIGGSRASAIVLNGMTWCALIISADLMNIMPSHTAKKQQ